MSEQQPVASENLERWIAATDSETDELLLLQRLVDGEADATAWWNVVVEAQHSGAKHYAHKLAERPLIKVLTQAVQSIITLRGDNFTPPSRTPWGGNEIVKQLKQGRRVGPETDASPIIGESWEVSGHPSFPSRVVINYGRSECALPITLLQLLAPEALYGKENAARFNGQMPVLVKFLNSGSWIQQRATLSHLLHPLESLELSATWTEVLGVSRLPRILDGNNHELHTALANLRALAAKGSVPQGLSAVIDDIAAMHDDMLTKNLSIQVHPKEGDYPEVPSKTEAWGILDAEPGAGIYLGLQDKVTRADVQRVIESGGDLSQLMNFVEVKAGDVFFIPSGTLHAIGAGVLLLEPQETSETTFRAYDWGRTVDGKPREMHVKETLKVTGFRCKRGKALVNELRRRPIPERSAGNGIAGEELLVDEEEFQLHRLTFREGGDEWEGDTATTEMQAFTIVEGSVKVLASSGDNILASFHKGQSFVVPAAVGPFVIIGNEGNSSAMRVLHPPK